MNPPIIQSHIESRIFTIRGVQVMIDRDLAELYAVETKRLNEQVKRNIERFPEAFRFELTQNEKDELVANCDRFRTLKHATVLPYAFTEQGVAMLSAVLRSDTAIQTSIQIISAFVGMRRFIAANANIFARLDQVEKRQISHEIKTDERFEQIFNALENKSLQPKQGIFYDGQVFDAYAFVCDLIRSAKHSIVLLDNYVDDTVLTQLSKAAKGVKITVLTKQVTPELALDAKKYNAQYERITLKPFANSHDRFLILDETEIYHIGASLKDLGKRWFAFSRLEAESFGLMERVRNATSKSPF